MREWYEEISQLLAKLNLEPAREAAIVREISQHLDDCYLESLAGGATPADAERRALAEFGPSDLLPRERRSRNWAPAICLRGSCAAWSAHRRKSLSCLEPIGGQI